MASVLKHEGTLSKSYCRTMSLKMTDTLETWPNVEVRSVIRIFACEVCQTDGNSSPVGGGLWSTGYVR